MVEEVDCSGSGHEVKGGKEDEEGGAYDGRDQVVLEVGPEVVEVFDGEGGEMSGDGDEEWNKEQVHGVGDQVMVAEFHIL